MPSNLTAYLSIPENSAATPGLFDSRYNVLHTNVNQVNTDLSIVSISVSQLSTTVSTISGGSGISGYRDVTLSQFGGAVGNGSTDDRSAFSTGATSTSTQAVLYAPSASSIYKIGSALTIPGTYSAIRGAVLRPASNVTIYHRGGIDAGSYPIWDLSAGGKLDFTNNREIRYYDARWFGITGDGVTDDSSAMQSMFSNVPDWSEIRFPLGMQISITTTVRKFNKWGIRLIGGTRGTGLAGEGSTTFLWRGVDGGTMFEYARCAFGRTEGFNYVCYTSDQPGGSLYSGLGTAIDCTMRNAAGSRIMSQEEFSQLYFTPSHRTDFMAIGIAQHSGESGFNDASNNEYHRLNQISVIGFGTINRHGYIGYNTGVTISTTASGSTATIQGIATLAQSQFSSYSGQPIRIAGAGTAAAGPDGGAGQYSSGISSVLDYATGAILLNVPASSTTTGAAFQTSINFGIGVGIGPSFNAKDIKIEDSNFNSLQAGIYTHGGSFKGKGNSYSDCRTAVYLDGNQSEPSYDFGVNAEQCEQYIVHSNQFPYWLSGRLSVGDAVGPSKGYIEFDSTSQSLIMDGCAFDNPGPTGSYVFDFKNAASLHAYITATKSNGFRKDQVGLTAARHSRCIVENKGWADSSGTAGEEYRLYGDVFNAVPVCYLGGTQIWTGPQTVPSNSLFDTVFQYITFFDDTGGAKKIRRKVMFGDATFRTYDELKVLSGSTTWNPPSLVSNSQATSAVSVLGAALGDQVVAVGLDVDLQSMQLTGYVSAASTVIVVLRNTSALTVDLASATVYVNVNQQA